MFPPSPKDPRPIRAGPPLSTRCSLNPLRYAQSTLYISCGRSTPSYVPINRCGRLRRYW